MRTNTLKLKNRRVIVGRKKDENICVIFKRLRENEEKEVLHSKMNGKIVETVLNISKEAAVSLFFLLQNELNMRDLAAFEIDSKQNVIKLKEF